MDCPFAEVCEDTPVAIDDTLDGEVIRQHGEYRITLAGISDALGGAGSSFDQNPCLAPRPVVNRELMAVLEEVHGRACTHVPKSDESDFHATLPVRLPPARMMRPGLDQWPH